MATSLRDADLREVGIEAGAAAQTLRLARLAEAAGCHGVVASTREVGMPRAFRAGATHIVIGRSITQADDPRAVFDAVCAVCAEAQAGTTGLT